MYYIKKFTKDLEQIKASKASGGRIEDVEKLSKGLCWESSMWIAERKLDGTRLLMHITDEGNRFTTRRISDKTGLYMERTNNFPHLRDLKATGLEGTVLDGEGIAPCGEFKDTQGIVGSSPEKSWEKQKNIGAIQYMAFDIIKFKGEDLRQSMQYGSRRRILETVIRELKSLNPACNISATEWVTKNKKDFYHKVIAQGEEGIMLKNQCGLYNQRHTMLKLKKSQRWTMIIAGFKPGTGKYKGMVGSIQVGFYGSDVMTYASGITDELRKEMSENFDSYKGRVVEIEAQEMTSAGSLRHPRFIDFRIDKTPWDCKQDQNSIIQ